MFRANTQQEFVPSKVVSVLPESIIDYTSGKQMKFYIPPEYGFIDTRTLKLQANVSISGRGLHRPDSKCGVHSFFRSVALRDGTSSTELENIDQYNALVAQWWGFTQNDSIRQSRALFEGFSGNKSSTQQLFHEATGDFVTTNITTPIGHKTVQVNSPIHCGLFDSGKVLPLVAIEGLRMSMNLETAGRALQLPFDKGTTSNTCQLAVEIADTDHSKTAIGDTFDVELKDISLTTMCFDIGDRAYITLANGTDEKSLGQIVGFKKNTGDNSLTIIVNPDRADGVAIGTTYPVDSLVFFKQIDRLNGVSLSNVADPSLSTTKLDFKLSDVKLIFTEVIPPSGYVSSMEKKMKSGEGMTMDFRSWQLTRVTVPAQDGDTEQQIPSNETQAYTILSVPLNTETQNDCAVSSFNGITDKAASYQYRFGTENIPDRPIQITKLSNTQPRTEALHLIETEKSIVNCLYPCRDLNLIWEKFFISRAFSKYGMVNDLSQQSLSLIVHYSGASKTKLFNHHIQHRREMNISTKGITVKW